MNNLIAFTRLLGYIQHFYPGDEAQTANWSKVAVEGISQAEEARDSVELAARLQAFFQPIAPAVQVFSTGERERVAPLSLDARTATRLLHVRHLGISTQVLGGTAMRERLDLRKESLFPAGARPILSARRLTRPWEADLGAGLSCRVPLVVYADETSTLPHNPAARFSVSAALPASGDALVSMSAVRDERLAGVMLAWNAMQHFSPYFDRAPSVWEASLQRALRRAAVDATGESYLGTLRQLVAGLRDGHGSVRWAKEAPAYYPPVRWDWVQGRVMVVRVAPGIPVDIHPGDVIAKIDGIPVREALRRQEVEASGATEAFRRRIDMQYAVAGRQDTSVELEVKSATGESRQITLQRTLRFADYKGLMSEPRPLPLSQLRPGVWYVDMDRCDPTAFQKALLQLASAQGIVFDLRGYPRLSLTAPLEYLTDVPLNAPPILLPVILFPDHKHLSFMPGRGLTVTPAAPRFKGRIVFLTDTRAISAAETFLAMIQHYHLGTIVGTSSAGTNGNVRTILLPGGYEVQFTGLKVLNYDGSRLHGRGIQPDIKAERTRAGVMAGRDELLDRALKIVSE